MRKPNYSLLSKLVFTFSVAALLVFGLAYFYVDDVSAGVDTLLDNILSGTDIL